MSIDLGTYIFERVRQVGVKQVLGVPGDYNMQLLDYVYKTGLEWVGNCNELNAAYAADGLSRAKRVPGVFVTTFGVGELSALNGVCGAHNEHVPLIHIVGVSARFDRDAGAVLHHAPPAKKGYIKVDHRAYESSSEHYSAALESLHDLSKATEQVDRVICRAVRFSQPTTLFVPRDMNGLQVPKSALDKPLKLELEVNEKTDEVVDLIYNAIERAETVALLADMNAERHNMKSRMHKFLDLTKAWGFTDPLGKSSIDETHPQYVGCYTGRLCDENIWKSIEGADIVLNVGSLVSDFNTAGFTRHIDEGHLIALNHQYATVFGKLYEDVNQAHVLDRLLEKLEGSPAKTAPLPVVPPLDVELKGSLTQKMLPQLIGEALGEDAFLVVETGTFQYEAPQLRLKKNSRYLSQLYYSSIGYSLPAAFGVALGSPGKRISLVIGDGSAQLTIQELANIVRHSLPVTVYLLNNDGYSIERCIWGEKQSYNDIAPNWQWTKLLEVMGAKPGTVENYQVRTAEEFQDLVHKSSFRESKLPQLVEVFLDKYDYPALLQGTVDNLEVHAKDLGPPYSKAHDNI